MNTIEYINGKIQSAKELDFGEILSESFDLFKKVWLQGFLTVVLIMLIGVPFYLFYSFILEMFGINFLEQSRLEDFNIESLSSFYSSNALYNFPLSIITSTITIMMLAGFYRICKQKDENSNDNDDYFYMFKKDILGKAFVLGLIYSGVSTISQFFCFIPYIYAFIPLSYFSVIFAFNYDNSAEDIMKSSFKLGNKKWLITFGTLFIAGILAMLGVVACVIGLLFTISFIYLPVYVIYKKIIGFDSYGEIDEIGKIEE